jgi:hypothetical protein
LATVGGKIEPSSAAFACQPAPENTKAAHANFKDRTANMIVPFSKA